MFIGTCYINLDLRSRYMLRYCLKYILRVIVYFTLCWLQNGLDELEFGNHCEWKLQNEIIIKYTFWNIQIIVWHRYKKEICFSLTKCSFKKSFEFKKTKKHCLPKRKVWFTCKFRAVIFNGVRMTLCLKMLLFFKKNKIGYMLFVSPPFFYGFSFSQRFHLYNNNKLGLIHKSSTKLGYTTTAIESLSRSYHREKKVDRKFETK